MKMEHIEKLKEIIEMTESVLTDDRERYVYKIISNDGEHYGIQNREEYLADMMDIILQDLCLLLDEAEEIKKA